MAGGAGATWIALVAVAATVAACRRAPVLTAPPATARVISTPQQLPWGPASAAAMGDIRLDNQRIAVIVGAIDHAVGFAATGGNIVDVAWLPSGEDELNQIFLYLDDDFPRQARYTSLAIVSPGGGTDTAVVRARGVDTANPRIAIETDYALAPGADALTITTRFVSSATYTIARFEIGDAVQWGRAEHFAPGVGFDLRGKRPLLPWVAGIGLGTSYAVVPTGSVAFAGPHGSMWSDPIGLVADLVPGKSVAYTRHLAVGRGDTASMAATIARLRGETWGVATGHIAVPDDRPIDGAFVRLLDDRGAVVALARLGDDRRYEAPVRPGRYRAELIARGRNTARPTDPTELTIAPGARVVRDFDLGPATLIAWRIEGDDGRAPPVKLTFVGVGGTPSPHFGPLYLASGADNVVLSARGVGDAAVAPGRYRVIVSRGPEFELIEREVEIAPGARIEITGRLERSIDTRGFISADTHQHAVPSFDSGVSLSDRALSNAAEGVDVLVSTEHNVVADYRPVIAAAGLGRSLASIIGTEATTHSVGHFNVFPLNIVRDHPRGGMVDVEGMSPRRIFEFTRGLGVPGGVRPFVQVNHPRAGYIGYFDVMKLASTGTTTDPRWSTAFDGVEVVAFGWKKETDQVVNDWFALLSRGQRPTAIGNSDSHTIVVREVGWPRTYVCLDDDAPTRFDEVAFTESLRRGCATVSAGPFVVLRSGAARMGDMITPHSRAIEVEVDVQAPRWVATDRLTLYVDGRAVSVTPLSGREPRRLLRKFAVSCASDCAVVARVDGDTPLAPVLSTTDGRAPLPIALTNPIYVDVDGDGLFHGGPR